MPQPPPLKTSMYLDLRTSHITRQDCDLLQEQAKLTRSDRQCDLICYGYDLGFFIPVIIEDLAHRLVRLKALGFSDDFRFKIYRRCAIDGIRLIHIDRDGDEQPLPEHAW